MYQDSSTSFTFRITVSEIASTVFLFGTVLLSEKIESRNGQQVLNSVKAIIRNDQNSGNTTLIGRRVADLETLGIIQCVSLVSSRTGSILDTNFKDRCIGKHAFPLVKTTGRIQAMSGDEYEISFATSDNSGYALYLNLFRVACLLILNLGAAWTWSRLDKKARSLQEEEMRKIELERRVSEQSEIIAALKVDDAIKSSLAAVAAQVSHDVRSPLSALNMVVKHLGSIDVDKREIIERACERINRISEELLQRFKQQSKVAIHSTLGTEQKNTVETEIPDLLQEMVLEKRSNFMTSHQLNIHLDVDCQSACAKINRTELCRSLSNLINNSAEALHGQGKITLAMRTSQREVSISVIDDGPGIAESLLDRLGSERMTTKSLGEGSGSGIGLLHAKRAVEMMGGKFSIHSAIGRGTMISMRFPRATSAAETA